ncbi:MAG: GSCFA domain-containing protein [Bacteroidota bacterium]
MKFRTELTPAPFQTKIGLKNPILSIGSCFADSMGQRFEAYKFSVQANPFGTTFNPISIFKLLNYSVSNQFPSKDTYLEHREIKANYDFHTSFSHENNAVLEDRINEQVTSVHHFLRDCQWVIITLGTAWVYQRNDNQEIVNNCHKVPARHFEKRLLTQVEILDAFKDIYEKLIGINPNINFIFTVSPVRHVKDSLELNSVSKSILRTCCHILTERFDNVLYFPSYELMMDDLRDYRFYKSDMLHPTEDAEEYIWNKFTQATFDEETNDFLVAWKKIISALKHRPFNPHSNDHQNFIITTLAQLERWSKVVNVDEEISALRRQLIQNN